MQVTWAKLFGFGEVRHQDSREETFRPENATGEVYSEQAITLEVCWK